MRNNTRIVRDRQLAVRRELDRRGCSLKIIAADSGVQYDSLIGYFPAAGEPTQISGGAIYGLCEAAEKGSFPADLLSWLLPDRFLIVQVSEGIDHDALCEAAERYAAKKHAAHRADSPGGVAIVPTEQAELDQEAARLKAAA